MSPTNRYRGTLIGLTAAPVMTVLLCAAAFTTTSAIAAPPPDSNSLDVSYVKPALSQPEAAESLYKRIQFAARSVCHEPDPRELARHARYQQCYDKAVDAAVANVDATALTALHRNRMQRSAAG
jgi:UrcA family protein